MAAALAVSACGQKTEWVNPDWVRMIYPEDGGTVAMDFFKPDDEQVFRWEQRAGATYRVMFDLNMHFEKPQVIDAGAIDSLAITNKDLLDLLRLIDPGFTGSKRFFWQVEQTMDGEVKTSWRYFTAMPLVESFTDSRDGEVYGASQFIMNDGSLITIMSENLRATEYSDGGQLEFGTKDAAGDSPFINDPIYVKKCGKYYTWQDATRLTWDEAKSAYENKEYVQGICPDGWHLPSYDEFQALREYFGPDTGAGMIKDPAYWITKTNVTNSARMNIVLSYFFWHEGVETLTTEGDKITCFWTSTPRLKGMDFAFGDSALEDDRNQAVLFSIYDNLESVNLVSFPVIPGNYNRLTPIRCIMDPM